MPLTGCQGSFFWRFPAIPPAGEPPAFSPWTDLTAVAGPSRAPGERVTG